jgi:hypothetical protein
MSWWQWILVSIGLYLAAGVIAALIMAYVNGVDHSKKEHPEVFSLDMFEVNGAVFLWPILLGVVIALGASFVFKFTYNRGKTRKTRKLERQGRKHQDDKFKELCKQEGWDYRKIKAAQP